MENFQNRLKLLRKERNLTQVKVANDLNTTDATINRYEKGIYEPNLKMLRDIANYFNVTTDYLLGIDHESQVLVVQPNYTSKQQEAIKTILLLKNESDLEKIIERAKTLKELE